MPPEITYEQDADPRPLVVNEQDIETDFLNGEAAIQPNTGDTRQSNPLPYATHDNSLHKLRG